MPPAIRITVQALDAAEPRNRGHCPIAHALKLSDDDILAPKVDDEVIVLSRRSDDMRYEYETPGKAVAFIRAYDAGKRPKPFVLRLDDSMLISSRPRTRGNPQQAIKAWADSKATNVAMKVKRSRRSSLLRGV